MDNLSLKEQTERAKEAGFHLASASCELRNKALRNIALNLNSSRTAIFEENRRDLKEAEENDLKKVLYNRLRFDEKKMNSLIEGINDLIALEDPVGKCLQKTELDSGLILTKVTTPIGLIGVIFESRPDAFVQIAALCLKSGNSVILKGGSEAKNTLRILYDVINKALIETHNVFKDTLQLVETREDVKELLKLDYLIDLMIPRGSNQLVRYIKENTRIPVLGHADGICHVYVDKEADLNMALEITVDAKCQYPAVCNAVETLLVHQDIADIFLPGLNEKMTDVELRGDERTQKLISVHEATEEDWHTEYNDLILSIKIVDSLTEAVRHINRYGSHHTDAIVTENEDSARRFLQEVDSSSVMWNCSTRLADGFRYGLGAEVGISTNKIHARGPVGLEGLTIYKYKLTGKGHTAAEYASGEKTFTHRKLS
jgi:glutamate-5-semialdehyde dehydrogenase